MQTLFVFIIAEVLFVINIVVIWFLFNKRLSSFEKSLSEVHGRIDKIFTVDTPSPNKATEVNNDLMDFTEENMVNVPPDVKFAVEGGDNVPPGFEEVKK